VRLSANCRCPERRSDDGQTILESVRTGLKSCPDLVLLLELSGLEPLTSDTKQGPRQARGSEPWPVMSARDSARCYVPGAREGRVRSRTGWQRLRDQRERGRDGAGLQAASAGVMVMVQPGLSFSSCRSR
jgi:hypothetical protein